MEKHSATRNIGIISAQRAAGQSADEFRAQHRQLARDIRANGLGYVRVRGASEETHDGDPIYVKGEHSYLVIGRKGNDSGQLKGFLRKHGEKYGQNSVLYKQHDRPNAVWIGTSKQADDPKYGEEKDQGPFHSKKIGQYFSRLVKGNKSFTYTNQNEELVFFTREPRMFRIEERVYSLDEVVKIINGEPMCEADTWTLGSDGNLVKPEGEWANR